MSAKLDSAKKTFDENTSFDAVLANLDLESKIRAAGQKGDLAEKNIAIEIDALEQATINYIQVESATLFKAYNEELETQFQDRHRPIDELSTLNKVEGEHAKATNKSTSTEFGSNVAAWFNNAKSTLQSTFIKKVADERELRAFANANQLEERAAQYPDSRWSHMSLVFVFWVIESILLTSIYAQGNEFGLLGGLLTAMLVASVSTALAFICGLLSCNFNHVSSTRKVLGGLGVAFFGVLFLVVTLIAAHYRIAILELAANLGKVGDSASKVWSGGKIDLSAFDLLFESSRLALKSFMAGPFKLADALAWVAVALNVVGGAISGYKGYTFDDVYPGYGDVDRKSKTSQALYDEQRDLLLSDLDEVIEMQKKNAETKYAGTRDAIKAFKESLSQSDKDRHEYKLHLQTADNSAIAVLKHMRSLFRKIAHGVTTGQTPDAQEQFNTPNALGLFVLFCTSPTAANPVNLDEVVNRMFKEKDLAKEQELDEIYESADTRLKNSIETTNDEKKMAINGLEEFIQSLPETARNSLNTKI